MKVILRLIVIVSAILLAACQSESQAETPSLVYGLTLRPSGFDPHIHQSSELGIVFRQVYDTLVYRDPMTREIVPGLAESWSISDDSLSYTFNLRRDVTFHDGTPFNAQAVAANLDRITDTTDPRTVSQRSQFMLGPYTGYEIVDDYTIIIRLQSPYSPLLDSFAQVYLGMASPTATAQYTRDVYQLHQVGTGPYKLVEFVPDDRIVLERNRDYSWGPSFYAAAAELTPERITYRFFDDPPTRRAALEAGDVQIMGELLPTDARALIGNSDFRLFPTAVPGLPVQLIMNTQRFPTDNTTFRQALIYATNRRAIVDTVSQGFSPVAWGPLSATSLYYDRNLTGVYDFNADTARSLLESIGYTDADGNGYLDAAEGDLELVIVHASWANLPETVQLIQDQWRQVGIRAIVEPVAGFPQLIERARSGEYNLISFDNAGYDPSLLNRFYLSDGANNFTGFESAQLDALLLQATTELSPSVRRGLYAQIQTAIMNQALILPIRDYVNLNAASEAIENLQFDAYGWFPVMNNVQYRRE